MKSFAWFVVLYAGSLSAVAIAAYLLRALLKCLT